MVDADQTFVIVGGGLAGAKAAETLRAEGFTGRVILICDERDHPYERPPLSKGYLLGKEERDSVFVHEPAWYAAHDIELHLGQTVDAIDRAAKTVRFGEDGTVVRYDKLLLATGAEPRRLDIPGTDLAGVHHLRRLAHAERLKHVLTNLGRDNGHLVIAGAGWIGLEVAAAAREYGAEVTVVEHGPTPLHDVLAAIGAAPRTHLAEAAGLEIADRGHGGGIVVDERLRTSDPDVYAAGDVVSFPHPLFGTRVRVEHWANALNGGPAAARAMLGREVTYDRVPYFFSDQYDLGMEYSGWAPAGSYDQVVIRGDAGKREFIAFWVKDGRVLAGMNVNVWDVTDKIQRLVRSKARVNTESLADPHVPLDSLAS